MAKFTQDRMYEMLGDIHKSSTKKHAKKIGIDYLSKFARGSEPCEQGFERDPVTGECIPIREKVEDIQEMPSSIVQKPPWYQESFVNPAAYVSGYRGGDPRMYKYGFLNSDQGQIIGGGGFGFPKPGVHLSALGVVPTSSNDRQYFKGAYEAGISKDFKNLNLGLGVNTAITGYPGDNGFVRDPIKLQPKLNLKYNFAEGGALNKFVGGDPCPPCPDGTVPTRTAAGDCPCPKTTPYRDVTGKPLKVLPKSGTIYVTDLNDPKILEYKRRQELYEMSKKQYSKILKQNDHFISYKKEKIIEMQDLLKEPSLTQKEKAALISNINYDNIYIANLKKAKALQYDDWLKSAPKLNKNNIKIFADYNTYDQKNIYNKGVKQYKIYPEYTTDASESSDRALLYPKPSLTYVFADPKKYTWNEIKKVEIPPIVEEEKEEEKEEEFIPMPIKKPELISTITGDIIGQSEQLLAPEYSPSYPENRIGYDKYNWYSGRQVGMGTKWTLPKRQPKTGGFYDKMSKKVEDIKNYMEGYEDEDGNHIPGEIEKAEQEGRQINFEGHSSIKDKKAQETYNKEYDEYENLKNYQNQMMNLMQYKLNKKQFGGPLAKFVSGGMPDPGDVTCDDARYEFNPITGRCVLIKGEPGFIKNNVGEWVQDVAGKTVVEDENDEKYKDYLIRKQLSDISKIPDWNLRKMVFEEFTNYINNPNDTEYDSNWKEYYDPEKGYDFTKGGTENDEIDNTNNGYFGSRVQLFNNLTEDQVNENTARQFLDDQGFTKSDIFRFRNLENKLENYKPDNYLGRAAMEQAVGPFYEYSPNMIKSNTNDFTYPSTDIIENKIDIEKLKNIFPNITEEDIKKLYIENSIEYIANERNSNGYRRRKDYDIKDYANKKMISQNDKLFKDFTNSTENFDNSFVNNNFRYYKPDDVRNYTQSMFELMPNYLEPVDKYIVKKTVDNIDPSVELYTNPDAPEYSPTDNTMTIPTVSIDKGNARRYFDKLHKNKGMANKGLTYRPRSLDFGKKEVTRLIPSLVQKATGYDKDYMEGYIDDDGNYVPGEIENAEREGRQINFQGRTSLKDKKAQEAYNQEWTQYQIEKDAIKKQNIELLQKYNLPTEKYLADTKEYGGLHKFITGGASSGCKPGEYWNGTKCVPVPKGLYQKLVNGNATMYPPNTSPKERIKIDMERRIEAERIAKLSEEDKNYEYFLGAPKKAKYKAEPLGQNSMAAQFSRQDFNKKSYDNTGKEIKPILWDPDHTSGISDEEKARRAKEKARLAAFEALSPEEKRKAIDAGFAQSEAELNAKSKMYSQYFEEHGFDRFNSPLDNAFAMDKTYVYNPIEPFGDPFKNEYIRKTMDYDDFLDNEWYPHVMSKRNYYENVEMSKDDPIGDRYNEAIAAQQNYHSAHWQDMIPEEGMVGYLKHKSSQDANYQATKDKRGYDPKTKLYYTPRGIYNPATKVYTPYAAEKLVDYQRKQEDWDQSNIIYKLWAGNPKFEAEHKKISDANPGFNSWLMPTSIGVKGLTTAIPLIQAAKDAWKAPLPLGKFITSATAGQLTTANAVGLGFGAHGVTTIKPNLDKFIAKPNLDTGVDLAISTVEILGAPGVGTAIMAGVKPLIAVSKAGVNGVGALYNDIATGDSFINNYVNAWKSPAANLTAEESAAMFNEVLNSSEFTTAEKALIREHQYSSFQFQEAGPKQDALNALIEKINVKFPKNSVVTRKFYDQAGNEAFQSVKGEPGKIEEFSIQDRPTAFSVGKGSNANWGKDRVVMSGRNLEKVEGNFVKNTYEGVPENYYGTLTDDALRVKDRSKVINENSYSFNEKIGDNYYGTSRLTPEEIKLQAEALYEKRVADFNNPETIINIKPRTVSEYVGKVKNGKGEVYTQAEAEEIVAEQTSSYNQKLELYGNPANKDKAIESIIKQGSDQSFSAKSEIWSERELIASGFDMKVVGKVKNELGGYDYIVKPRNIRPLKKEPNWQKPSETQLKQEFKVEHELKGNTYFGSEDEFMNAIKDAKVEEITPEMDASISYRSRTGSKEQLVGMSKGYNSWPEFRNEGTIDEIYNGMKSGKDMDMPIVLEFPDGTRRVFSGNTRMDVAFQSGKNPKVLVVKVPENVNSLEANFPTTAARISYNAEKNKKTAAIIEQLRYDRYLKINSPEGKIRIEELIANNPHMKNMTYEDVIKGFTSMANENAAQTVMEEEFALLSQRIKNLEASPNPNLSKIERLKSQASKLEGDILFGEEKIEKRTLNARMLRKTTKVASESDNTIVLTKDQMPEVAKDASPSDIYSILASPELTVDDLLRIVPHEFTHFFQQGSKTNLDKMLSKISLKTSSSSLDSNLFSNEKGISNFYNKLMGKFDPFKSDSKYWRTGSNGQEKTAFMDEVRADMLQRGMIEDLYQTITPELLQAHYVKYMGEVGNKYPLRIYEIMNNNSGNFNIMSEVLNKMPVVVPTAVGVGVGVGVGTSNGTNSEIPQNKYGGNIKTLSKFIRK